jgi:hypothetical protein
MTKRKPQNSKRPRDPKVSAAPLRSSASKGKGTGLMLMVPAETLKALRVRAAEDGTTVRALVLEALSATGYPVPADELIDRRKRLRDSHDDTTP